jgi:pectate lyase/pectin methylesterase-like acyl-CoA thioesterase
MARNHASHRFLRASLATLLAGFGTLALAQDVARQVAPADGWAAIGAGTRGGADALVSQIYTVRDRLQLVSALAGGGTLPKIIKVVGVIDMSEGVPFTSRADQTARGSVVVPSNTTLIGAGPGAGLVNGSIIISGVSQVIVRNLRIVAPCDVAPVFDPTDGATGSWNANFDAISVIGSSNVWIDRNTITDAPVTDDTLPIVDGQIRQCHDGAIDITLASDLVSVTYNLIEMHDKTVLIGGSDSHTGDAGRLRVTVANNVFRNVRQRAPRVRFGQVHVFNNYYEGTRGTAGGVYAHSYSIGVGKSAQILSHANALAVAGASGCASVVQTLSPDALSAFADSGSLLNGVALGACPVPASVGWTVPYVFRPRPATLVKVNALAQAGAGKISTSISGTGGILLTPGTRLPAPGDAMVQIDTPLRIAFDGPPRIGSSGFITIARASDGVVVDRLDISTAPSAGETQTALARTNMEIDALGQGAMPENPALARWVWYRPILVEANVATIRLRSNKLRHGTAYTVSIDPGVLTGTVAGAAFGGVTAGSWSFTTRPAPASPTALVVDDDGATADFRTLQGALNWVMLNCTRGRSATCGAVSVPKRITLMNGSYPEYTVLRWVENLTIRGESRDGVRVGLPNFESFNSGSGGTTAMPGTTLTTGGRVPGRRVLGGGRAVFLVENADLLQLENFTLENPHVRVGTFDNQAKAIYFNTGTAANAARMVAREMTFLAQQDTLQLKGYVWVWRSLIEGNVDYIWGSPRAALFEQSEIRSVVDPASSSPGFILQSRAVAGDKGFVFLDSVLTAAPGVTRAYLGRSGSTTSSTHVDHIAFINTRIGPHILPVGWCVGTGTSRTGQGTGTGCSTNPPPWAGSEGTADGGATDAGGWREFNSTDLVGAPLDLSARLGSAVVRVASVDRTVRLAKTMDSIAGFSNRAEIFFNSTAATGAPGGWDPVP